MRGRASRTAGLYLGPAVESPRAQSGNSRRAARKCSSPAPAASLTCPRSRGALTCCKTSGAPRRCSWGPGTQRRWRLQAPQRPFVAASFRPAAPALRGSHYTFRRVDSSYKSGRRSARGALLRDQLSCTARPPSAAWPRFRYESLDLEQGSSTNMLCRPSRPQGCAFRPTAIEREGVGAHKQGHACQTSTLCYAIGRRQSAVGILKRAQGVE